MSQDRRLVVVELLRTLISAWQRGDDTAATAASAALAGLGVPANFEARQPSEAGAGQLLLDARSAAKSLSISPRSLWSLTKSREIAHVKAGRRVLYDPKDLADWIARNRHVGSCAA